MNYKIRKGKAEWNEKDWVITDSSGKPIIGFSDQNLLDIMMDIVKEMGISGTMMREIISKNIGMLKGFKS